MKNQTHRLGDSLRVDRSLICWEKISGNRRDWKESDKLIDPSRRVILVVFVSTKICLKGVNGT